MGKISLLLCAVVAVAGCGTASSSQTRRQPSESVPRDPSLIPSLAVVVCEEGGTRVMTPRVRPRRDGIHIRFVNPSGAKQFHMRAAEHPDDNHGGFLRGPTHLDVSSHGPGPMLVACLDRGERPDYYGRDDRYDELEVVDVNDLWIPFEVDCDDSARLRNRRVPDATSIENVADWLRERYGLQGTTRERPGYPLTQWKGDPWVLRDEGRTLASFNPTRDDRGWMISTGEVCRTA